ncbi:CDK-activating kinase assembly factor MAT1 [Galendromus occidentalis]|uniref:CDK-activating kinase assembly factor MAT1 n=1 Tax=Galendromus occidentalis TaxID=34638 RepID=A0AAJ6QS70_9ACAR|nr:CDK-activating kinase assembly factor MAT1 [Galendromus occidentalis]
MDDIACPRCKTTKFRNPALKLMVNQCGHPLCEKCVEIVFIKGSGNCTTCNVLLRRNGFRFQVFDDPIVEKELDIRKKVLKDFNAREEDFATLREYNDYLEMVEDIVFKLTNNIEVDATRRKIDQYKKDNKSMINKNRGRQTKDDILVERLLEEEKMSSDLRVDQQKREDLERKKALLKEKEDLIDELMFSDLSAAQIVALHDKQKQELLEKEEQEAKERSRPATAFSTGIKLGSKGSEFLPVKKAAEAPPYEYKPLIIDIMGPPAPTVEELEDFGYLNHIRGAEEQEKAGGFESKIACERAIQSALCGLYFGIDGN